MIKSLKRLFQRHFQGLKEEFVPGKTKIPLSVPAYGWQEVVEAMESLLSTWVTMGEKVRRFERLFAKYVGVTNGIMVNSGSSANLLALSVLSNPKVVDGIRPRDEVITPAVTWATTVYPIANVGAVPVLVDVDLETYNIDPDQAEKAVTRKTKAILPIHLLGNPCDMRIMKLARDKDLFLVEDCCEAHGAECDGRRVGSFGDLATFSFFISHHITTIEGGMVVTNIEKYAELAKALRAFGWIRDLKDRSKISRQHPDIDARFLFANLGFNFRPTEIQGAFGIHQMNRLEEFIRIRRQNAEFFRKRLEQYSDYLMLPHEKKETRHVWFGYPITVFPQSPFTREELTDFLERKKIETRPIMAGNFAQQPVAKLIQHRIAGSLNNSRLIMSQSFFFGNHHEIDKIKREYIVACVDEFMEKIKRKRRRDLCQLRRVA